MIVALIISSIAALATVIGGVLATHPKMTTRPYLAMSLAFAAGAMLFVSFGELLPHSANLHDGTGGGSTQAAAYIAFFAGMLLVGLIDRLLPSSLNPSEIEGREDALDLKSKTAHKKLLRSGVLVTLVLALHNFPEGLSTFMASYENVTVGISLAIAIAIHNIPEGIAIAAPIYASTKNRNKAITWASISGAVEIIGAVAGAMIVGWVIPAEFLNTMLGLVAGMMVFVAIDELLPAARRYQTSGHQVVYGVILGMAVVALSLTI